MQLELAEPAAAEPKELVQSPWRLAVRHFARNPLAVAGLVFIAFVTLMALFAPVIAPYKFDAIDLFNIKAPPSAQHWLGTDELGRDELTRLLYGARVSLSVGLLATLLSTLIGLVVGAVSGYFGGWIDTILMRFVEAMLSFPSLFLLIILASLIPTGIDVKAMVLILGLFGWMGLARLIRAEFLAIKQKEYAEAAVALGVPTWRIMLRHFLPNALGVIIVSMTLGVGGNILSESALSFLGVGIQPPTASWGNMLTNAQDYVWNAPWLAVWPGLAIFLTVLAFNFVGDGLRDAFDPHSKR
ncbi:MAG: ABC transporter permease [Firmicutes bacterium]|nr:ABC transporter permease [Bacillota bacterium]